MYRVPLLGAERGVRFARYAGNISSPPRNFGFVSRFLVNPARVVASRSDNPFC